MWERRVRDGRGLTVVTDEDVVGRVATVGFPTIYQGAATLRTSRTNRFTYTVAGMIDHVDTVDSGGTLRTTYYKYDDARRRRQADSPEGVLTWQRDAQGNIIAMQGYRRSAVTANAEVTGGTTTDVDVAYGYDAMNRLSSVTDRKVSTTRSLGYAFDAAGRVQTATYPNGATNRFTYDVRHRLLKTDWWQTNGTLMRAYNYTLSPGGVRVAVMESVPTNSSQRSISWQYDLNGTNQLARLYRLTSETITNLGSLGTEQHVYDLVGNRLSRSVTGFITNSVPTNSAWTDNARDELNVDTYDGAGNTTIGTSLSLTNPDSYDAENHLILRGTNTAPVVQIDYDAFGNRVKKTAGGTTTWYLVDDQSPSGYPQVVAEFNSLSSAPLRTYAYGLSLIDIVGSGTTSYALTDGQGSVRALFSDNAAATLTDNYDFDAYGVLTASSGSTVNNYRYTGQQWDPDLQLYYLRARYYAPTLGRFWSSDSYEGNKEETGSIHKYVYCRANCVNSIDPSGHDLIGLSFSSGIDLANWAVRYEPGGYKERIFSSFFTHGPLGEKLFHNFIMCQSTRFTLSIDDMVEIGALTHPNDHPPGLKWADKFEGYRQRLTSGSVQITDMPLFLQATEGSTLGHFYSYFTGTLSGTPNDWKFEGTMRFEDVYDFEYREEFGSVRNMICFAMRNGVLGKNFNVDSVLAPVTQTSKDSEVQWKGTGHINYPRGYDN